MASRDTLGRLPSPDDSRDFSIRSILPAAAFRQLPARYRIASWRRIGRFDQQENSCVGQSLTGLKIVQERRRSYRHFALDPLFLWGEAKKADGLGSPDSDRGTYPRVALKLMQDHGHALIGTARWESRFKIGSYFRLRAIEEVKAAIKELGGGGVNAGSWWYESWMATLPGGLLPKPDREIGGHAWNIIGWDDGRPVEWDGSKGVFIAANSWGDEWGSAGDFLVPYSVFGEGRAVDEAWKVLDA